MYTKEFLVSAFLSRYMSLSTEKFDELERMAEAFFASAGRDKFRIYCSLDAEALETYRNSGLI